MADEGEMSAAGTLARYISKRFLIGILGAFALCVVLIFMIDLIELLRQAGKFRSVSMGALVWISLLRLPAYAELTLPFAVLVGSIGALLMLSRKSELVVARSAGMSVWLILLPGIAVALLLGAVFVGLYNPLAAAARAKSEALYAEAFERHKDFLKTKTAGPWLRQDGVDGQSVIHARASSEGGMNLARVTVLQYDRQGRFVERIDARRAMLNDGFWELRGAWVSRDGGEKPAFYERYLVSTYLTPAEVKTAVGSVISISFWELPAFIAVAEKAGLPATRYKVQYELLRSRPALLAVMVLLAATVSLRAFRFGGIQTMVVVGLVTGFGFFLLAEVSRQVGVAGLTPPEMAAWAPVAIACCLSLAVLMHQEDG